MLIEYVILATLAGWVAFSFYSSCFFESWWERIAASLLILIPIFMSVFLATVLFSCINYGFFSEKSTEDGTCKIYSMNNGQSIHGSFVIGCGVIDSKQVYTYFEKLDDGGLRKWQVEANKCIIYQDKIGNDNPHYTWQRPKSKTKPEYTLFPFMGDFWALSFYGDLLYNFHIPENSIINNFELN